MIFSGLRRAVGRSTSEGKRTGRSLAGAFQSDRPVQWHRMPRAGAGERDRPPGRIAFVALAGLVVHHPQVGPEAYEGLGTVRQRGRHRSKQIRRRRPWRQIRMPHIASMMVIERKAAKVTPTAQIRFAWIADAPWASITARSPAKRWPMTRKVARA